MTARRTVVVMAHHGVGDFLMAVPVLRALSADSRGFRVSVVVKNAAICAFGREVCDGLVDEWHLAPKGRGRWLRLALGMRLRRPLGFLGVHAKSRLVGRLAQLSGARIRVGPVARDGYSVGVMQGRASFGTESVYDERRHKVYMYRDFLRPLGIDVDAGSPNVELNAPNSVQAAVEHRFPRLVAAPVLGIAPACGLGPHKKWFAQGYAETIREVARVYPDMEFALLAGPGERAVGDEILAALGSDPVRGRVHDWMEQTSLTELLAVMSRLVGAVCVCNGPSHLAAAAGIPIVGLYGPTNPGFTGAFSDRLYVVRKGYACSPCYRTSFNQGCGNPRCMTDIEPAEVVRAVCDAVEGRPPPKVPALSNSMATEFRM